MATGTYQLEAPDVSLELLLREHLRGSAASTRKSANSFAERSILRSPSVTSRETRSIDGSPTRSPRAAFARAPEDRTDSSGEPPGSGTAWAT
jgi:hypothetical protein